MLSCHRSKIGSKRLKFVYHVQLTVKILKSGKIRNIISITGTLVIDFSITVGSQCTNSGPF